MTSERVTSTDAAAPTAAEPVVFVHVMKTGGTTLVFRAVKAFGDEAVWPVANLSDDQKRSLALYARSEPLLRRSARDLQRYRLVAGHQPFVVVDELSRRVGRPLPSISVLRDPVERVVSHAKQLRVAADDPDLALEAIIEDERFIEPYLSDHQTKVFAATPDEVDELPAQVETDRVVAERQALVDAVAAEHPPDTTPRLVLAQALADVLPERWTMKRVYRLLYPLPAMWPVLFPLDDGGLDRALANLERVDVLGVQDRYDAFVDAVQDFTGWDLPPMRAQRVSEPEPVSASLRRRILELNRRDVELYERALELAV